MIKKKINYISLFKDGGSTENSESLSDFDKNNQEAKMFYQLDVIPRAEKYRTALERTRYSAPSYDESIIQIDPPEDFIKKHIGGYYLMNSNKIHVPENVKALNLVHEMAHNNQSQSYIINNIADVVPAPFNLFIDQISQGLSGVKGSPLDIPRGEIDKIQRAYKVPTQPSNSNSNQTREKHASNRELRYVIWSKLKDILGRYPTIQELNDYILQLDPYKFRWFLTNGYQYDYFLNGVSPDYDAIKKALIEVADNNSDLNQNYV